MIALRQRTVVFCAGFSFIELLASLAILAALAALAMPLAETAVKRSKEHELRRALRDIRGAIDRYKDAADAGKVTVQPDDSGYPLSLASLVDGVDDLTRPGQKLILLRRLPRDPFAADPSLPAEATWSTRAFSSPADAPRAGEDVFDVSSRSEAIGLNGIAYKEW